MKELKLEPTILYEDETVLVLNKPAGLLVHGDGRHAAWTLADWLLENRPDMANVGESMNAKDKEGNEVTILRPGIVHRLDQWTSGVMVVAKTDDSFKFLKRQFSDHTVKKAYRAFLYGHLKHEIGTIDAPIGRSGSDIRMWNAGRGARGVVRDARTRYRVISLFRDPETNDQVTYVEGYPETGRTHQLRVHFRFLHHPIVSDSLYAGDKPKLLGFNRVALHAFSLEIAFAGGERKRFEAPLPADFAAADLLAKG